MTNKNNQMKRDETNHNGKKETKFLWSIIIRRESMRTNNWNPTFKGARSVVFTILMALCLVLLSGVGPAAADQCLEKAGYSCTYEIEENPLQPVPPFFKFQSRISQAKLPVGDVTFSTIYVNVKRGDAQLCQETFNNVMVRDSVLNLEIGRTMSCDLASIIAKNDDLKFQVCIGNMENCLKPISLSSVPFAIKATYASLAQKAAKSNEAMQCHYAHRLTADRNLFTNKAIGKGYYDFHTPATHQIDNLINLYDSAISVPFLEYYNGGYIQWMQVDPTSTNLHICAQKDDSQHDPMPLDELYMHAQVSRNLGQLVVDGPGNPSLQRMPLQGKALTVTRSGMDVHGSTDMYDNVYVGVHANGAAMPRQMRIDESHVLNDWGVANFYNDVFMGGQSEIDQDTCDINHHLNVDGTAFYSNFVQMGADNNLDSKIADINHHLNVDGTAFYSNFVEMGSAPDEKDLHVNHHLDVDGTSDFNNDVTMGGNDPINTNVCDINHFLNVDGTSDFNHNVTMGNSVDDYTVDIISHLDVHGTSYFDEYVEFGDTVDGEQIDMNHILNAHGTANFSNHVNIAGASEDSRNCNINHTLNADGTSNFSNNVNINGATPNYRNCNINHTLNASGIANFTGNTNFEAGTIVDVKSGSQLNVNAPSDFFALAEFHNGLTTPVGSEAIFEGTATFKGQSNFNNNVIIGEPGSEDVVHVYPTARFHGDVIMMSDAGISGALAQNSVMNREIDNSDDFEMHSIKVINSGTPYQTNFFGDYFSGNFDVLGVQAKVDGNRIGVYGEGGKFGVVGITNTEEGFGVFGFATGGANNAVGVSGVAEGGSEQFAMYGHALSGSNSVGVAGVAEPVCFDCVGVKGTAYGVGSLAGKFYSPNTDRGTIQISPRETSPSSPQDGDIWLETSKEGIFVQAGSNATFVPGYSAIENRVRLALMSARSLDYTPLESWRNMGLFWEWENGDQDWLFLDVPDYIPSTATIYKIVVTGLLRGDYSGDTDHSMMLYLYEVLPYGGAFGGDTQVMLTARPGSTVATGGTEVIEINQEIEMKGIDYSRRRIRIVVGTPYDHEGGSMEARVESVEVYYR